jgi:hypothetical protein
MPTPNMLNVLHLLPNQTLGMITDSSNWNCCDNPNPGDSVISNLQYNSPQTFMFCRKGGHGCDGNQGVFVLDITGSGSLGQVGFSIDGDGNIGLSGVGTPLFQQYLFQNANGQYTWVIFPLP